jgi:4-carboxymuconolactone decarboxylase
MRSRRIIGLLGLLSAATWSACSTNDAVESAQTSESASTVDSLVLTADDIQNNSVNESWARLPLPHREQLDLDGQSTFDMIVTPGSRYESGLRGPVAMWVYSPLMAKHLFPMSTYLRFGTEKDQRITELTILATAREVRSQYEWTAHQPAAERAGLEPAIIDLIKTRTDLDTAGDIPGLGDLEQTIIRFVREVVSEEKLSSSTFDRTLELLGEQGVMNLAGLVGYYEFVNTTLKTFDVQVAPGRERLLPDLW